MAGRCPTLRRRVEGASWSSVVSAAAQIVSHTLTKVTSPSARSAVILSSSGFLVLAWWGSHWAAGAGPCVAGHLSGQDRPSRSSPLHLGNLL